MMIPAQATLFPLYDRNAQSFVAHIFDAKPGDSKKATQRGRASGGVHAGVA